ncbi:MAG TPA: MerR family transcriptional regulator [Thermoanaerobaculia bacterium]|nr:MerR family transcriptional regulator [Thermoanaerobaculia bacterium]
MAKAERELYKPADACRMAEVAPYVLRYWETEFPALSEGREKGNARLYTARDVQIIARIRQLLYDEGFTVAGAKKRLEAEIQEGRFDGEKPGAGKVAAKAEANVEAPAPRPVAVPPPPTPPPAPAPAKASSPPPPVVKATPPPPPEVMHGFPERRAVIKELKDIVRLLEKSRKH